MCLTSKSTKVLLEFLGEATVCFGGLVWVTCFKEVCCWIVFGEIGDWGIVTGWIGDLGDIGWLILLCDTGCLILLCETGDCRPPDLAGCEIIALFAICGFSTTFCCFGVTGDFTGVIVFLWI